MSWTLCSSGAPLNRSSEQRSRLEWDFLGYHGILWSSTKRGAFAALPIDGLAAFNLKERFAAAEPQIPRIGAVSEFAPDSPLVNEVKVSRNHSERHDGRRPDLLVLHYTGMESTKAALDRLCGLGNQPDPDVSVHYFVHEDGGLIQCVPEARRAWHAGVSCWEGDADVNSRSIGIEIANPGHNFGYPEFAEVQIRQVIALCREIIARHSIRADRVLAHSDVAPSRKKDPGEKFPWRRLFEAGVGLWVDPTPIAAGPVLALGDRNAGVSQLQGLLAEYGYPVNPSGFYGDETRDVVAAFQRHFRPARVDGIADGSTLDTLERLVIARRALLSRARMQARTT